MLKIYKKRYLISFFSNPLLEKEKTTLIQDKKVYVFKNHNKYLQKTKQLKEGTYLSSGTIKSLFKKWINFTKKN